MPTRRPRRNVGDTLSQPIVYRAAECARPQIERLSYGPAPAGNGSATCDMVGNPSGQWGEGVKVGNDLAQLVPLTHGSKFEVD